MMRRSVIVGTGAALPERRVSNAELAERVDTSDEWIVERTGIRERRIAAPEQASSDLALIACRRALEMANVAAADVDQIVLATTTPVRIIAVAVDSEYRKLVQAVFTSMAAQPSAPTRCWMPEATFGTWSS